MSALLTRWFAYSQVMAVPHDPRNAQQACKLLNLPPELRNRIYELVVGENVFSKIGRSYSVPPLLSTGRQIRSEASSVYYGGTKFGVFFPRSCFAWLSNLAPESQAQIRKVAVFHDYSEGAVRHAHVLNEIRRAVHEGRLFCNRLKLSCSHALWDEWEDVCATLPSASE